MNPERAITKTNMSPVFTNVSTTAVQTAQLNPILNYGLYISDAIYNIIQLYLVMISGIFLSILGTAANVIITVVYYRQGVKESATVSYIVLALADTGLCFLTLCVALSGLDIYFPLPEIDFIHFGIVYVSYTRSVTYMLSTLVTVYLSVELCICITIPLKVKLMFTKTRSIIINCGILLFSIACSCPAWATQQLSWQYNLRFNRSRLTLLFTDGRNGVEIFFGVFNGNTVLIASQTISIVCAVLLISGIKKSVAFRKQVYINQTTLKQDRDFVQNSTAVKTITVAVKQKVATDKYAKLAKVTVLLTIVFLVCNIPVMVVSLAKTILPGLFYNPKLYSILYFTVYGSTLIKSSANLLVYYNASERFRTTFLMTFSGNRSCRGVQDKTKVKSHT